MAASDARDLEIESRLVRIETKMDAIIKGLENPKQSPESREAFARIHVRLNEHDKFRDSVNQKIAWVSGAFAVILTGITWFIKHIIGTFSGHSS
jgi:hypothetical protein